MAHAKLLQPRGGDQVGLDGVDLFEHFYVEIDAEGDDPLDVLQDRLDDDPFDRTGVPLGQSHPDPKYALATVRNYRVMEGQLGPLGFIVLVYYTTPEIPAIPSVIVPGWKFSTSVIGRTKRLLRDLDGKPIGNRATKYTATPPVGNPYKAISQLGDTEQEVDVSLSGDNVSSPVGNSGMEVDDGIFAFTLHRMTLAMTTSKLRLAKSSLFHCNHAIWRGYPAKNVLISDVRISEEDYHKPGSNRSFQYSVTVELWQADKDWTQESLPVLFEEDGKSSPVYQIIDGVKVPESTAYRVRDTIDLDGFLFQFSGFNP